jgi:hypothetical protein
MELQQPHNGHPIWGSQTARIEQRIEIRLAIAFHDHMGRRDTNIVRLTPMYPTLDRVKRATHVDRVNADTQNIYAR